MSTRRTSEPVARNTHRQGFVLVSVLLVLLLVAAVAGTTHWASWRAARDARLAWNGERALHSADRALMEAVAAWDAGAFAALDIGGARNWTAGDAAVELVRTAPLEAVLRARGTSEVAGAVRPATRRSARWLRVDAPPLALPAALVAFGAVNADPSVALNGADVEWTRDGCGPSRDTASVDDIRTMVGNAAARSALAAFVDTARARGAAMIALGAGMPLPPAPPWRARIAREAVAPPATPTGAIAMGGPSAHRGLLLVDGDLVVDGPLVVEGLLVVLGSLDGRGGTLDVLGAVIVAGERRPSDLRAARVSYSRCAVERALATVAVPSRDAGWWSDW